jgi:hypothetical protein
VHPLRPGELAGSLDGRRGDVNPERATCLGHARGLTGRLPAPASDVQDMLAGLDPTRPAQYLIVPPQLGVVVSGTGPVRHGPHLAPVVEAVTNRVCLGGILPGRGVPDLG